MYQSTTRAPHMHQWAIADASQLPLADSKRKMTDVVCMIIGILFGLILFIMAIVMINQTNLKKAYYPTDTQGNVCIVDAKDNTSNYPYLFFENVNAPNINRFCVDSCPQSDGQAKCFGNCAINYYPNELSTEYDSVCLPTDESIKQQLLQSSGLSQKYNYNRLIKYSLIGFGISFGLSLIWILLAQFLPRVAVWTAVILSAILLLIAALIFFTNSQTHLSNSSGWAIALGITSIILLLMIIFYAVFHHKQLEISAKFLQISGEFLKDNLLTFIYIPIFIIVSFLFGVLIIFEYLAFSSYSSPALTSGSIYYQSSSNGFLFFLLFIQAIWGFSFFRDLFNYCISGLACDWYFNIEYVCHQPLKRVFTKNFGSVVGGAFLSGFFYLPSLIISFLMSNEDCCICNLFDLTRSDVYAYIYLTGNSFCASSRQSQYLCYRSRICRENESAISIYAFAARIVMALAVILIIFWITAGIMSEGQVPGSLLLGIFFICLYVTCYFIDIHTVTAQALMICFLSEYDLDERWSYKQMRYCPQKLRNLISDVDCGPTEQVRSGK